MPEAVAQHPYEHADGEADEVEGGGDEARLDERQAKLGALRRERGRNLADVGAADEPAGEHGPHGGPANTGFQAALTGIFSSTIFFCQSAGPLWCTEVPFASTATVTGMSFTSNS